jgi:hypothetical protein
MPRIIQNISAKLIDFLAGTPTTAPEFGALYNQLLADVDTMTGELYAGAGALGAGVAFVAAVPLDGIKRFPAQSIVGPTTFTVGAGAVAGGSCEVRLTANGINTPNFTAFREWGGSGGWVNTAGVENVCRFWNDGVRSYVSIVQDLTPAAIPTPVAFAATSNTLTITFAGAALATGSVPATSAFTVTQTGNGGAALTVSNVAVNAGSVVLTLSGTPAGTVLCSYVPPVTNSLRDASANIVAAWSGAGVVLGALLLDIAALSGTSIRAAYSLRKLRSAYTGAAVALSRTDFNGGTPVDVGFDVNGNLDTSAAIFSTGSAPIRVSAWYNQGAGAATPSAYNFLQGNTLFRPTLAIDSDAQGRYVIVGDRTASYHMVAGTAAGMPDDFWTPRTSTSFRQNASHHAVVKCAETTDYTLFGQVASPVVARLRVTNTTVFGNMTYNQGVNATAHTGFQAVAQRRADNVANVIARRRGTTNTSGAVTLAAPTDVDHTGTVFGLFYGAPDDGVTRPNASIAELLIARVPLNDTQRDAVASNQDAYWITQA